MTDIPNTLTFPTDWHPIDVISGIECRQLSENAFELRSSSHVVTIDRKAFDLWRVDSEVFYDWIEQCSIPVNLRDSNGES